MMRAPSARRRALVCALLPALGACQRSPGARSSLPPLELEGGGVKLSRIAAGQMPRGAALRGRAGDFLVESARLKLVVGAEAQGAAAELGRGAVLDLTPDSWREDGLEQLSVVAHVEGRDARLVVRKVEAAQTGEVPLVRVLHETRDGRLLVSTEIRSVPGAPYVELVSKLENRSGAALAVRVGERVRFSREPIYAERLGEVAERARASLSWFASGTSRASWGMIYPDGPVDVVFDARTHEPKAQLALSPEKMLAAGAVLQHRRMLSALPGDIAGIAALSWRSSGVALGYVEGALDPPPKWATIEARTDRGEWLLQTFVAANGRFRLALPEGTQHLRLRAPGGSDEETVKVSAGAAAPVHLLVPAARRLVYRVLEGTEPIPARLVIRGIPPTADPELGPPHSSAGAGNVTYTAHGAGGVELPPGRYRVLATRGVEYTIAQKEIDVTAQQGESARFQLSRVVNTRDWLACDFHLHADPSGDSEVPLPDRITSLLAEGIEY
ncbi:MAG TPA: hypothetical protein VK524_00515, partial [Polyangiaceae bacterium]|nr:hypothetical protein [Polyangiaceae bacterium]